VFFTRKFYGERLRELQQLGFAVPFQSQRLDTQPSQVIVEQCGSAIDNLLLDLGERGTLYMVWLSLAALRPGISVTDFRFIPPWLDVGFQSLQDFPDSHRGAAYVLPNNWEFPREDVLNLNFGKTGWRVPCTRAEGLLCAWSATPIPKEYKHGAQIPTTVGFFVKSGRQVADAAVLLWADRSGKGAATRAAAEKSRATTGDANPPAVVQPLDSVLFEGGERTDSREAHLLRAEGGRSRNPKGRSLDRTEYGTGVRGAADQNTTTAG